MLFSINSLYNISLMIKFHRIVANFGVNHGCYCHKGKVPCYNILVPFVVLGAEFFVW
nr:MAG TPA: hypothetical protein [Caudoviricetes sp.]